MHSPQDHFPQTLLHFQHGQLVLDLREGVTDAQLHALRRLGLGDRFGVITASNPKGELISPEQNEHRHAMLDAELRALGVLAVECDGTNPDLTHREAGFAVSLNSSECCRLAVRFEQLAYFYFDGSSFWIKPALAEGDSVQLPRPR